MKLDLKKKLSENFTLEELVASDTAKKVGIDNTPTLLAINHLEELCQNLLQPIREAYGRPIKVTSGFRCYRLNRYLGGSPTSAHPLGWAADLKPVSGSYADFEKFVVEFLKKSDLKWDQVIRESSNGGKTKWLHLGYKNGAGRQRRQIFDINV